MYTTMLYLCLLSLIIAVSDAQKDASICRAKKTCKECIAVSKYCAWCKQDRFYEDNISCDFYSNLISKGCSEDEIYHPDHKISRPNDEKVRDGSKTVEAVQIQPQNVTITLRPNKPITFDMTFRLANNYPVDLYYLMDLSASMKDDKEKLATLGRLIAMEMEGITEDFRLGFGSFVDKVTMPYVSTIEQELLSPCPKCAPAYSFKHQLSLNTNASAFERKVKDALISGNLDSPESGFDAVIQAIACKDIGWRDKSRRMLLFSTDASSHLAGDGKLGGIVKPNDGQCYLDNQGFYSKALEQDYPSMSQIASKVSEKKVNLIFAVTANQFDLYERMSHLVDGSTVGKLSNDSSNIVKLVSENYNTITSKVELLVKHAHGLKVTLKTRCLGKGELKEINQCSGLKVNQTVTFEITLELKECPKNRDQWKRDIEISAVGLNDALGIKLELLCECDCEKMENTVNTTEVCSGGKGMEQCGICTCHPGFTGDQCQCDGTDDAWAKFQEKCIKPGTKLTCMGRGTCNCGKCECDKIKKLGVGKDEEYEGRYCQCDHFGCTYHRNRKMCGGPGIGNCVCGKCDCADEWEGEACECTTSNKTCIAENGAYCNNLGTCKCGVCTCTKNPRYSGPACDECATCGGGVKCEKSVPCVQCRVFKTGNLTKAQCEDQCPFMKVTHDLNLQNTTAGENFCQFKDEDGCRGHFKYSYMKNGSIAYTVKSEKDCPEPVNILAIVGGVIGGIVLIGLLILLIWKLVTMIQDRREYAKFQEFNEHAKWDTEENPIYKKATSTFKNPTYQAKGVKG